MKIPIVNEQDEIIKYVERSERLPEEIMRVTSVWITDSQGNILLQQRKFTKRHSPGKWGPAAAGGVEEGETYESNAYKELEEEVGIKNVILKESKKIYGENAAGKRFVQIYTTQISKETKLIIQEDEVEQVKWVTKEELKKELIEHPDDFVGSMHTIIRELFL